MLFRKGYIPWFWLISLASLGVQKPAKQHCLSCYSFLAYPSPNGQYIAVENNNGEIALYNRIGRLLYRFPSQFSFFPANFTPWGQQSHFLYLLVGDHRVNKIARFNVFTKRYHFVQTGGFLTAKLVPSANGRYVALDVNLPNTSRALLGIWDTLAQKPHQQVLLYPFRLDVEKFAWVTDRLLFVNTNGRDLEVDAHSRPSQAAYMGRDEDFLLDRRLMTSRQLPLPFRITQLAPYADASVRIVALARGSQKGSAVLVSIDPTTGESYVEKELPTSTKSPWLLTWSSPQRVYVWRWRQAGEIEVYVYRSLARPHVGALHEVKVSMSISFVADSAGRVCGYDGKRLRFVQLPLK
jgi:hypothetical protein